MTGSQPVPVRAWTTPAVAAAWLGAAALTVAVARLAVESEVAPGAAAPVLVAMAVPLVLGTVVARAAPGNPEGPLLAAAGLVAVLTALVDGDSPGPWSGTWMLLYLPLAILLLLVPDGVASSRRWAAVGWGLVGVVVAFITVCAIGWWAPSTNGPMTVVGLALLPPFLGLLVACAAAPIARYRRAGERDRVRLRWVFLAGTSLPFTLLLCWTSYLIVGTADLAGYGLMLMYLAIPLGVTIAITRPNLFDIDRATVATATAAVLGTAVLLILSAASAVAGLAIVQWSPPAAIILITVVAAGAGVALPFLRRALDRLLYPERGRAVAALADLSARIDAGSATPAEVQRVLRTALRDPALTVAYRDLTDRQLRTLDGRAAPTGPATAPVHRGGEDIGAIIPSDDRIKRPGVAVSRAAAPIVDAIRTDAEITRARAEVEASRERILRAGYAERRRLERDLHDGAQQRLVALGMRLRVLQHSTGTPGDVTDALDGAVAELATAVAELRQIAQGVRPSALDDGLDRALAELARLAPATVELDLDTPPLTDAVATTAYYVISEAVTNALRHGEASRIRVRVRGESGVLEVRVDDDGRGGAALHPTGGLTGLSDRVAALGGTFRVDSPAGAGTSVEARLPCAS